MRAAEFAKVPRNEEFTDIVQKAFDAGLAAGNGTRPTPMQVRGYAPEPDGMCGFAWVIIKPGTSRFAKWLKATKIGSADSYHGGVSIWVSDHNQSHQRKQAHAAAMANVLSTVPGVVKAVPMSRLD